MSADLAQGIKAEALRLGFDQVGITTPEASEHGAFYRAWLAREHHGAMGYLSRPDAVERRENLSLTLPGVRSVVVVADAYEAGDAGGGGASDPARGVIARYARGADYHRVLRGKLERLRRWTEDRLGTDGRAGKVYVDTGPVLERELARRAGLGWFGRNTMLIDPRRGSYFLLGALFLEEPLPPDAPFTEDRCGSCRACLDACPTGALLGRDDAGAPVMDARRCISYLTIELRGPIPRELRPAIGNRIFGCDICQEVCPWNQRFPEQAAAEGRYAARGPGELPVGVEALPEERSATAVTAGPLHPGTEAPSLVDLMRMTRKSWDAFSRGSAIRRAGYEGFKRNVAVALGNWLASMDRPPEDALAVLRHAVEHEEPLIAEHATWALEQLRR